MCFFFFSVFFLFFGYIQVSEWNDSQVVDKLFGVVGVKGIFVFYDVQWQCYVGYDWECVEICFVFVFIYKVVNSLIGLFIGVVRFVDEVFFYGGKFQCFKVWEYDMSLCEVIKVLNVLVYQELVWCIGLEWMCVNVLCLGYGNVEIGQVVDNFWLVGLLKISVMEQICFLF